MEPVGPQDLGVGGTPSLQHGKMTSQFVGLSGPRRSGDDPPVYGHLGQVSHRSDVIEYRVEQHPKRLGDRVAALSA